MKQQWKVDRAGVITASMFKTAWERVGTLSAQQQALVEGIRSGLPHSDAATKAGYKAQPKLTDAVQRAIEGLRVHMCARTCTRQIGKTCQHTI